MFLHTFNPNPILAKLGPFTIHWYGLFLSIGAIAGYLIWHWLGKKNGFKTNDLDALFFWTIIAGFIGARLYHVTNEWSYYVAHPKEIVAVWNGGLAIHGALIVGLLVFMLYAHWKKLSFWLLTDVAAAALVLGQAIGRWGNYFNQELFGKPTNLPWGIPINTLNRPLEYVGVQYFHPTFLYESLGSLLIFGLLLYLHKRNLAHKKLSSIMLPGFITLTYLITHSLLRFGTELLRIDRVPLILGARLPLLTSLFIALAASVVLLVLLKRRVST